MSISELIGELQSRLRTHGEREVKITWESTKHEIDPSRIYLSQDGPLYIDADGNFYKSDFAVDPHEGD